MLQKFVILNMKKKIISGDGLQYLSTMDRLFVKQNQHAHEGKN